MAPDGWRLQPAVIAAVPAGFGSAVQRFLPCVPTSRATRVFDTPDMDRVKAKLGVPDALASRHTAEVGGYVIEGHAPAEAVRRLLAEKPRARGLAAPGMPVGSPGMDAPGAKAEPYEIVLFGPDGQRTLARYPATREI